MDLSLLGQLAFNGVLLGLVYGLVGLGLALALGVMGILNISHGALYMLGGYLTFYFAQQLGLPPVADVILAVAGIFVVGVLIDRTLVQTTGYDETSVMMVTFGLAIILGQIALLVWGGNPISTKPILQSTMIFGSLYTQSQIFLSSIVGVAVAALTILFLRKSKMGKAMRMVSQNREAANVLGVSTAKISAISLGIGSCYAGLAGALLTPVYLVYPDAQWAPLIAAFVVVIVGGLGSVSGAMIGGLIYGILETIGSYFIPAGSEIMVLVLIIIVILIRPSGLFGTRSRV
ncbi:MAG: branched-chain amino acid ABC transporter permease [Nitrososphaerota archaeon]|nr:branched-chain amino acid ABC transporter permease [Nitrososphaerota archaeon]